METFIAILGLCTALAQEPNAKAYEEMSPEGIKVTVVEAGHASCFGAEDARGALLAVYKTPDEELKASTTVKELAAYLKGIEAASK